MKIGNAEINQTTVDGNKKKISGKKGDEQDQTARSTLQCKHFDLGH